MQNHDLPFIYFIKFQNYCPLIWHFCSEANIQKLEKIQERALRFIYNNYDQDYDSLLLKAMLPTLHVRRLRSIAIIETYKIINKEGPTYLHDLLKIKSNHYSCRYNSKVDIPNVQTSRYGLQSFRYVAAKLWNDLPNNIRKASSFGMFKNMINKWNDTTCSCTACC